MTPSTDPAGATCPGARLSQPTLVTPHGRRVIDIDNYIPYFLAAVNNALSRGASSRYLTDFGVGVTEWRVLSWLATEPGIPASRICDENMLLSTVPVLTAMHSSHRANQWYRSKRMGTSGKST